MGTCWPCAAATSSWRAAWTARRAAGSSVGTRRVPKHRIAARIAHFAPSVGALPAAVIVRDLGKRRWGSCDGRTRTVSFHWQLILLPPAIIDYVVVHELVHLHELNHGSEFWRRVVDVLPDCRQRRAWLAAHGQRHVI